MIEGSCTDFTTVYTVWKLEKKPSDILEQQDVVITFIWRSQTGVRTYSKKLRSASNVVIVIMQSGILPGNWHKFSSLGIYQSILNPAVLQICKIESEKIQQKSRSFWNEVSSNNAKSPFPG